MTEDRKPRRRRAVAPGAAPGVSPEAEVGTPPRAASPGGDAAPGSQLALALESQAGQGDLAAPGRSNTSDGSADRLVGVSAEAAAGVSGPGVEEITAAGEGPGQDLPPEEGFRTADLEARPLPYQPVEATSIDDPALLIRMARIHLRTGSAFMARAELEALAAREQLDTDAHLDLAEARWRTGDLAGAGEAAAAYAADGGREALGLVISAEALAMAGRDAEARRLVELALERHTSELDPLFAGMPHAAPWPAGAWIAGAIAPETVKSAAGTSAPVPAGSVGAPAPDGRTVEAAAAPDESGPSFAEPFPGETEGAESAPAAVPAFRPAPVDPAGGEIAAGRSCLDAGDPMTAALHFGVAIRLAPASAAAVLEALGDRRDLPLQLVRGDALRLLGQEVDASDAYVSLASALGAVESPAPGETGGQVEPAAPDQPALSREQPARRPRRRPSGS